MNNTELTPTERLALQIQDLNAQLQLKDEELFFAKAANARLLSALQRISHPMADDDDLSNAIAVIASATGGRQ